MRVPERVHKVPRLKAGHLGHHHRQQRIAGDVERHAKKDVRRPLVKLTTEPAVSHVKLEQGVARRQRHLVNQARIPGADDNPARIRPGPNQFHRLGNLVNCFPVGRRPAAPLVAVNRPELTALVRPLIPDAHPVFFQVGDVRLALKKPEQLMNDRPQVQLLGRHARKAVGQIKPHLVAEQTEGARVGPVGLAGAVGENAIKQVEILAHTPMVAEPAGSLTKARGRLN